MIKRNEKRVFKKRGDYFTIIRSDGSGETKAKEEKERPRERLKNGNSEAKKFK